MRWIGFLVLAMLAVTCVTAVPELPRITVDTTYIQPTRTITLNAGDDLQDAIDDAVYGDEIVLPAGATFPGPINLPLKQGSGWITIRSSRLSELPAGTRVNPSKANLMPVITSPGFGEVALKAAPGAHHYRIAGVEFKPKEPVSIIYDLIRLGTSGPEQTTMAQVPSYIILDRVYAHGNAQSDVKRCVGLNSAHSAVIDSYLSECHTVGQDSQAIGGFNGPGPFKINNNYLEGAAENVIFGGSDPSIPDLIPSDIEITRNHLYKPMSWRIEDPSYAGKPWAVKNLFELKNSKRVLVEGNVMENSWAHGQTGYAVLFTVVNQDGKCSWCTVEDVTFQHNIIRHAGSGFQVLGNSLNHPTLSTETSKRIRIYNNLIEDIDGPKFGGSGWMFLVINGPPKPGPHDVEIIHNTGFQSSTLLYVGSYDGMHWVKNNFVMRDNIFSYNGYGVFGEEVQGGSGTLTSFFPSAVFTRNALIGGPASAFGAHPGNFFPSDNNAVSFVDSSAGNYRLSSSSPYRNAATDGTDVGVNMALLESKTSGVVQGVSTAPAPASVTTPSSQDIIIRAADIPASSIRGEWVKIADATAASSVRIDNTERSVPKLNSASANPTNYFEITFQANPGVPYHLWLRMKASNNDWSSDSVFIQFSDSVDNSGVAHSRIGTTDATIGFLEEGSGAGLSGWGWNDNHYGSLGPHIYFAGSGSHTMRIQQREDGVSIDQIVLSPATYLTTSPGQTKNDIIILTQPTNPSPVVTLPGDTNGDGKVNMVDLQFIVKDFSKTSFDVKADLAPPFGVVDLFDVMIVVKNWQP